MAEKVRNHWVVLVILALAQFMVVLDSSVVNVALPAIQHTFNLTESSLQWVVTAYTLAFGGLLLFGGRAADLFGRKRLFLIGISLFSIASLLDGLAMNGSMLIILRAIQGTAAALMSPAALSIVLVTYREGHARNTALSVWGAVASGGAAAGVLLGGILTEYLDWRWNFFINVPIGIAVFIAARRLLPAHESEDQQNELDLPGAASITAGLMLLVYAITEAPSHGWTAGSTLAYLIASALLIGFFLFNERRVRRPLMPLGIFKVRNLSGANLMIFPVVAAMFSTFFFGSLYLQNVLGFSAIKTGLSFLVVPVMIALAATNVPRVVRRYGYKPGMVIGPLFIVIALFLFAHVPVDGNYLRDLLPGFILLGLGGGTSFVSATIAATSGVPPEESGLASGLLNTAQQVGGSLGLAILSGVAASGLTHALHHLPATISSPNQAYLYATVQSFHVAYYVGMGFALAGSLVAFLVIKQQRTNSAASDQAAIALHS